MIKGAESGLLDKADPASPKPSQVRPIEFTAPRAVRAAIARLGRSEDAAFSPDGTRIAIAGLATHRLLVLDLERRDAAEGPAIVLTGFVEVECAVFNYPHGVAWADGEVLIVANRRGAVSVVALPPARPEKGPVQVEPLLTFGGDGAEMATTPGSLALRDVGLGLVELFVCNNYVDHVTRHLIDRSDGWRLLASELLIDEGLSVPDGIALSRCGRWIAVSNHEHHNVLLFRDDDALGPASRPDGILTGISFPHGLSFAGDGRALLVADAGAPSVLVYRSGDGDWSGTRAPSETVRVLDAHLFGRGNFTPAEGGPKGVDLSPDGRVMMISCEEQPLAFFAAEGLVAPASRRSAANMSESERARATMARYLARAGDRARQESETLQRASRHERDALAERESEMKALMRSRSWRLTAPLRRLSRHWRWLQRRG